jgi:chemotaxis protein CheX
MTSIAELPTAQDLHGLVADVWTSFLGADASSVELVSDELNPVIPSRGHVISAVSTTGAWNGHFVVSVTLASAVLIARAMFGDEDGEIPIEDVSDAVGEIGNILAGNIKSILPQPSALSLPQVVIDAATFALPAVSLRLTATIDWNGEKIVASLWQESTNEKVEL